MMYSREGFTMWKRGDTDRKQMLSKNPVVHNLNYIHQCELITTHTHMPHSLPAVH